MAQVRPKAYMSAHVTNFFCTGPLCLGPAVPTTLTFLNSHIQITCGNRAHHKNNSATTQHTNKREEEEVIIEVQLEEMFGAEEMAKVEIQVMDVDFEHGSSAYVDHQTQIWITRLLAGTRSKQEQRKYLDEEFGAIRLDAKQLLAAITCKGM